MVSRLFWHTVNKTELKSMFKLFFVNVALNILTNAFSKVLSPDAIKLACNMLQRYNLYLAQMVHAALPGKYFHPAFCVSVRYLIINAAKCM